MGTSHKQRVGNRRPQGSERNVATWAVWELAAPSRCRRDCHKSAGCSDIVTVLLPASQPFGVTQATSYFPGRRFPNLVY